MEENKRRMFIGSKGQPSAVLRSKKDESEDDARKRLTEKGWNMEAPHVFSKKTEGDSAGTGEFRVTDPKPPRKRKKKAKTADDSEKPEEVKPDAETKDSDDDKKSDEKEDAPADKPSE